MMSLVPQTLGFWLFIGFAGQALFSMRFLVQWLATERARRSVVPVAFWYLSIGGGLLLLAYAIWRQDPVFIVGQATGLIIYLRNLYFIHRLPVSVPAGTDARADASEDDTSGVSERNGRSG
jgi:lipid-A-disaccharide synthase-like uncharacterized protein